MCARGLGEPGRGDKAETPEPLFPYWKLILSTRGAELFGKRR